MPRGKLQLKLIENLAKRRSTYRRRIKGLKQKAQELSTLCGVEALVISYGPSGTAEFWPENKQELRAAIARYGGLGADDGSRNSDAPTVEALDLQLGKVRRRIEMLRNQSSDLDFEELLSFPQLPLELLSDDAGCANLGEMMIMEDVGEESLGDQFGRINDDVGCVGLGEVFMDSTDTGFPQPTPEPILDVSDYPLFDVMPSAPIGLDDDSDMGISWQNSFDSEWPIDAINFDDFEDMVNCWS